MAKPTMQQVKELRDRTQAGLNDCKGALEETDGDMEKAVEVILKKGLAKSAKRAGAIATEGEVAARVSADGRLGVMVEVNIQTDFAARNDEFKKLVAAALDVAMAAKDGEDLGAKPHPSGEGTLEDARQRLVGKLGENITFRRWARLEAGENGVVASYVHMGGKMGALVKVVAGSKEHAAKPEIAQFLEQLAMQVVATSPLHVRAADVPEDVKAKQGAIFEAQVAEMDKPPPEKARAGIVTGKVAKWMKEICLLDQESVVEPGKTIETQRAELAKALGTDVEIAAFHRYERGEGIEKPADDFVAEATRMSGG